MPKKSGKENRRSSSETNFFDMLMGNDSAMSEQEETEMSYDELDNTKDDKDYMPSESKNKRKRDTLNSSAMSVNLNILNGVGKDLSEPVEKKRCSNEHQLDPIFLTSQNFRPTHVIYYTNINKDVKIVDQILANESELNKNYEIIKPKKLGKNLWENPEEKLVQFQLKKTKNDEPNDSFFSVSNHQMKLFKVDVDKNTSEIDTFYIYESYTEYSNIRAYGFSYTHNAIPSKVYSKVIDLIDREYFILGVNDNENCFFKVETSELNSAVFRLVSSKNVSLVLNNVEHYKDSIILNLNIFLTEKCRQDNLIQSNPSFSYLNFKNAMDIHYIMTHYYLSHINHKVKNESLHDQPDKLIENLDDNEVKNRNENLFDLIYDLHQNDSEYNKIVNCSDDSVIQDLSCLKPGLRPYQIKAIKWMLYKENFTFDPSYKSDHIDQNELHPLYIKIVNEKNDVVYYHKYFGVFTKTPPLRIKSLPGGILADEMGLGKTLEILSLLMINSRNDGFTQEFISCKIEESRKEKNKKSFSCLCGNTPESFQLNNYKRNNHGRNESMINQCVACLVWTHVECVNYRGKKSEFLCLECCTKVPPIKSGCTLIVTPSIISHQWVEEIRKHVGKKINVHVYKGTNDGFIQPRVLASLDVCITTYDVLSNELAHVFAIENQRSFRKAKRFSNIPSPLICVEWWRICLDEAQMVHSTNSRCAEMANRLQAVNRWCVTGTPVGRSLADLHGLFAFIREDPYTDKKWFKYCLFDEFQSGNKLPMAKAVSNVLWRTSKRFVENQINIPKQTEICYWLDFSPFEAHLYQRVLEVFRDNRKTSFKNIDRNPNGLEMDLVNTNEEDQQNVDNFFSKFLNGNSRLDEVEKSVIDQVLSPLIDLRLACNHPQLVLRKRSFMAQTNISKKKDKLLTMEKSLEILMKKTQSECDKIFRTMTMHSNAIAGLYILNNQRSRAIETYQKILDSEKEYDSNVSLDLIQKVHTYHNYIDILQVELESSNNNQTPEEIESKIKSFENQLKDCEKAYILTFDEKKTKNESQFKKTQKELSEKLKVKSKKSHLVLFMEILEIIKSSKLSYDFWENLSKEFSLTTYFMNDLIPIENHKNEAKTAYSFCGKTIKSINELEYIFTSEFDQVIQSRGDLLEKLDEFSGDINQNLVVQAADCHLRTEMPGLRPLTKKPQKCKLCKADNSFNAYAKHLFSNSVDTVKLLSKPNKNNEDSENEIEDFQIHRTTSDLEKLLKLMTWFCKSEVSLNKYSENLKEIFDLYNVFKQEFQQSRQYWLSISSLINSMDELDMAKTRLRFLGPGEKNTQNLDYIIEPSSIKIHFCRHDAEQKENRVALGKKLGQLVYLKHSLKTYNLTENEENTEPCPICQSNLGFEWYILSCGHLFCKGCYSELLSSENSFVRNSKRYVRCAMCREDCSHDESQLVSTKKQEETNNEDQKSLKSNMNKLIFDEYDRTDRDSLILQNVKIKGECNSAKVEGVIKCIVKILREDSYAKCLVFSENLTMLELIIDLLKDNSISFGYVKDNYSLQKKIDDFKKNSDVNVLLMPYSFGANGLNIIEATHVLLVEPTLNKSQEIQAIGRVHRIGQTKPTFVYRFMIRNSIEEHVYSMFKSNTSYSLKPNYDQPMCSKTLLDTENKSSTTTLTINDIKKLFISL